MMKHDKRKILFVGGIPSAMTEEAIQKHFEQYGEVVRTKIMKNKKTNLPKGYAFVTMANFENVSKIVQEEHTIEGRRVDCQVASKKGEKKEQQDELKKRRVFVTGFSEDTSNEDLVSCFELFGKVKNGFVIQDFATKVSKKYGYVEFEREEDAGAALSSEVFLKDIRISCHPYVGRHEPKNTSAASNEKGNQVDGSSEESMDETQEHVSPIVGELASSADPTLDEANPQGSFHSQANKGDLYLFLPEKINEGKQSQVYETLPPSTKKLILSTLIIQPESGYRFNQKLIYTTQWSRLQSLEENIFIGHFKSDLFNNCSNRQIFNHQDLSLFTTPLIENQMKRHGKRQRRHKKRSIV